MVKSKTEDVAESPMGELVELHSGKIPLSRIDVRIDLQIRKDGVDQELVKEYARELQDPTEDLPEMVVFTPAAKFNDKCQLLLADGFHRIDAYRKMGRDSGPFIVYRGDEADALRYAIGSNAKHGKPLTQRDRKNAILLILSNKAMKGWPVRRIARLVGCSKSLVQLVKSPPEPKTGKPEPRSKPQVKDEGLDTSVQVSDRTHETARMDPGQASGAGGSGPMIVPPMVRERQPSTLVGKPERLEQVRQWVEEGHLTRADAMNLFSGVDGNLVYVKVEMAKGMKTLRVRHNAAILIEADVSVNAELPAVIDVSVSNPKLVEYSYEDDPFAVGA